MRALLMTPKITWWRQPDPTRTLLYLQLNNNVQDSSGNGVSVSSSSISYGTMGNNHYAELTAVTWYIRPTATIWQQIGTGDFTVSFFMYPVSNVGAQESAWWFGDWYDSWRPRPWICIRASYTGTQNEIEWVEDGVGANSFRDAVNIDTWYYMTYVRKNGVAYGYLNGQLVWQASHTTNLSNVNKFFILNRNDYSPQRWKNTWARISEVILEKVAWTEDEITWYFSSQKWNYGIS